jgi:hypothetical protein
MKEDALGPEPLISEEEKEYFRLIEERFCALRGASMLLSPRDWALMESWWRERVPLSLVLDALEEIFAARVRRGDPADSIGSLAYVRGEVRRRFLLQREWAAVRRGEEEESQRLRRAIRLHLGRLARRLALGAEAAQEGGQSQLCRSLLTVAGEIRILRRESARKEWDPSQAEEKLGQLEAEILDAARAATGEAEREEIAAQARNLLAGRLAQMSSEVHRETLLAMEQKLLRQRWGIPRLTLLGEG